MSAAFYYYPDASGTLEVLTLAAAASVNELQDDGYTAIMGESFAGDGTLYQVLFAMPQRFQVRIEKLTGEANRRALENLINHLRRGNSCGFALNDAKAWGSFTPVPPGGPIRGATSIVASRQAWYSTTATLANDDPIRVESGSPVHLVEHTLTAGSVANTATSVSCDAILTSFPSVAHVCHRDFWPVCRFTAGMAGRRAITSNRRMTYDVEMELYYDLGAVMALQGAGPRVRQVSASKFTSQSLEQFLSQYRTSGYGGNNG